MDVDNIESYEKLSSPKELKEKIIMSNKSKEIVDNSRKAIADTLKGKDKRKIFIVGPCSIHNPEEALEYAVRLKNISDKVKNKIIILMRVYLEKPRTTLGWKGFISDPFMDLSYEIEKGLELSRKLLLEITEKGIPVATEFLDPLVYPYIGDFVSFGAIGARTTESQIHRQLGSGFSMPVGYKNSTSGSIDTAINAIKTSSRPHSFIGVDDEGKVSKIMTKGNENCYLVLRGGETGPNYESDIVKEVQNRLRERGLKDSLIIDCSHGNSGNDYKMQKHVFRDVVFQMKANLGVKGLMLESNLEEGKQEISNNLRKGVSITDACIGWEETEKLILEAYKSL